MAGGSFNRSLPKTSCERMPFLFLALPTLAGHQDMLWTCAPEVRWWIMQKRCYSRVWNHIVAGCYFSSSEEPVSISYGFHTLIITIINVYHCLSYISKDIDYRHISIRSYRSKSPDNSIRTNSKQCCLERLRNRCLAAIQGMCFARWNLKLRQLYQLDLLLGLHWTYEWFHIL